MNELKYDRKSLLVVLFIAVVLIIVAAAGLKKIRAKLALATPMIEVPLAVRTVRLQNGPVERTIPALATVKSAATVQIRAETGGRILTMAVREGDVVKKGQTLALIDSREQDAQLQAAAARSDSAANQVAAMHSGLQALTSQLDAVKTNLSFWAGELKRDEELFKAGAIAQSAFENTRNRKAEAESKVAGLQSQIQSQKSQIEALQSQKKASEKDLMVWKVRRDYSEITAPVDGIVSMRLQEEGNRVMPGAGIYSLEDTSKTRLLMQIPHESTMMVKPGQQVRLQGNPTAMFTVSRVYPVQNDLRQITVEAETSGVLSGLVFDMQVSVRIVVSGGNGVFVPSPARFPDFNNPGRFFVYLVQNGFAQRISVQPVLQGDNGVSLVDGLALPEGSELAVGAYLENIRLPASFPVEVIR